MISIFYISAAVAVISTLMAITRTNAVHALLYLIVSLLSVALIFFVLGAPFAASLEVIIYAGAIMVLFVFVIMMLNLGPREIRYQKDLLRPETWLAPSILIIVLAAELLYLLISAGIGPNRINEASPKQVGIQLLGRYLIGVELASILLLAALIGAFHLGRRRDLEEKEGSYK